MTFPQTTPVNLSSRGGNLLATASSNTTANVTNAVGAPVYTLLHTAALTTTEPSTKLAIFFYASWFHTGAAAFANVAAAFRFSLNGVLIPASRGTTGNEVSSRIVSTHYVREVTGIAPGVQTVTCEWTKFGPLAATLAISAASLPDLMGSAMVIQSIRG